MNERPVRGTPVSIPQSEDERPLIQAINLGLQLCFLKTHTTCLNENGIMLITQLGTLLISKIPLQIEFILRRVVVEAEFFCLLYGRGELYSVFHI